MSRLYLYGEMTPCIMYARRKRTQICQCTGCAATDFLFVATIADLILIETDQDKRQITV